ncbi:MAG: hypothetical protein U5J99_02330 [Parvularculaceae bacterium]|nr:hypothetical protein [Parvularculaceae bacterium]
MPTINEVMNLWPLLAAVLTVGLVVGWFGRQLLLRGRSKELLDLLYSARGKFIVDERMVVRHMEFISNQVNQMRASADAQIRAANLTVERMEEFETQLMNLYVENIIPDDLEKGTNLVRKLDVRQPRNSVPFASR